MDLFQREMPLNEADPNNLLMHINRYLERIHAMSSLTIDDLKQAILGDPVLKAALTGQSGETFINYSNSIIKNGAFEYGFQDWTNIVENGKRDNLPVGKITKAAGGNKLAENTNKCFVNPNYLYKATFGSTDFSTIKSPCFLIAKMYNNLNNMILRANTDNYLYIKIFTGNGNYQKQTAYFGGIGNLGTNFTNDTAKITVGFLIESNTTLIELNSLLIEKVDLGEAVPFNLPFLPSGQMVFDPTDGSVGRYDGTTIHWFTME